VTTMQVLFSAPYMLRFYDRFLPVFEHYGIELITPMVKERLCEDEILVYAGKFDGTICGDDRYSESVLKKCLPRLKVISKWGTGIDSIDSEAAARLGIQVLNTPGAFTIPVSDTVIGYILAFSRQLPWMDRAMKSGEWEKIPGRALSECTLGVVGVGRIGQAVLRKASAFGMKLLGNDIKEIPPEFIREIGVESVSLAELMECSDFISVNADLNPTSRHLINEITLAHACSDAVLINTARGPIIDENALINALQNKKLHGAALDVFESEPLLPGSPLKKMDNVLLAPHNSNSSPAAWERVHWNTIHNLLSGLGIDHPDLEDYKAKI
jgi:D-3-phosphoglycerate dehydrogenase